MPTKVGTPVLPLRALLSIGYIAFPMLSALGWIALIQSAYFLLTGLWPIFHIRSFMRITGPKNDLWLVRTVRLLLTVIIPAFNEEKTLSQVIERVLALPLAPQVIVISDGSTDGTNWIIQDYQKRDRIIGVILPQNRGKGAAIQAGLQHATQPYTIIQDADLEYSPEQFGLLLEPIRMGKAAVVYGSRNLRHPHVKKNDFHYIRFWLGGKVVTLF